MATKKALFFGCGGAAVLVLFCGGIAGLIVYFVFALTGPAVDAANEFLGLLGEGKTSEAYARAATGLKNQQSEAEFAAMVRKLGLNEYQSASFPFRNVVNQNAELEGTITTKAGGRIPVKITLVRENDAWRVLTITGPEGGVAVESEQHKIPPDAELRQLVKSTILDFNAAVKAKDFSGFYAEIAALWQRETSPKKLQESFQAFIDKEINLDAIADLEAVFDAPPALGQKGFLNLQGYFPTRPNLVAFELSYTYEHPAWKLVSINLSIKPPAGSPAAAPPSLEETRRLVRATLLDFNAAVQKKDFTEFYKNAAAFWQKQTTPEKLKEVFQPFIDAEVNIAPIDKLEAVFDPDPAIGANGLLSVKGHYPTKPSRVVFDLTYAREEGSWKLVGISVKVEE